MVFRMFQFSVLAVFIMVASGCGGLSKNTKLSDQSKTGIVIASVTQTNAKENMFVWIRRVSDHDFVPSITGNYSITTPNVNVFELPAGEYEFHRWSIVGGNSWANLKFDNPYRFTVTNGIATYVGNFDLLLLPENRVQWKLTDTSDHDIKEFKQRFPLIGDDRIKIDIAKI
ncbi:hypothetical protein [Kaarinaea lacus]